MTGFVSPGLIFVILGLDPRIQIPAGIYPA